MGDHDHRVAGPRLLLEHVEDLHAGLVVEVAGGFVGDEDRVARRQRSGDGHSLLLPAGQLSRVVQPPVREPYLGERCFGRLSGATAVTGDLHRALHVLDRGERREQVERLEDERDGVTTKLEQLGSAGAGHRLPGDRHHPVGRHVERTDQVEQGGLAAPRGTEHDDELAGVDLQIDVAQGVHRAPADLVATRHADHANGGRHTRPMTGMRDLDRVDLGHDATVLPTGHRRQGPTSRQLRSIDPTRCALGAGMSDARATNRPVAEMSFDEGTITATVPPHRTHRHQDDDDIGTNDRGAPSPAVRTLTTAPTRKASGRTPRLVRRFEYVSRALGLRQDEGERQPAR